MAFDREFPRVHNGLWEHNLRHLVPPLHSPAGYYSTSPSSYGAFPFSPPAQAPSYELTLSSPISEQTETLLDWLGIPFTNQTFGNMFEFIDSVSPSLRCPAEAARQRSFELRTLWAIFDVPYGVTIELVDKVRLSAYKHPESEVHYTPQLSGFHFTVASDSSDDASPGDLSWFCMEKTDLRRPMYEQLQSLAKREEYRTLFSASNTDFTVGSWFAVLWEPIHIKNHVTQRTCGSFLCFYLINPPIHVKGSGFTGSECAFRTDCLGINRPLWTLSPSTKNDACIDSISSDRRTASGSPESHASDGMDMPGEAEGTVRVPIFGMIPLRVRPDVWFRLTAEPVQGARVAPLFLIAAAAQLIQHEERTNHAYRDENRLYDMYHMVRHEPSLQEFISLYVG